MNLASKIVVAAVGAAALVSGASGAITGVTGQTTWLGSPPVSCNPGALVGITAFAWDEQQNITLAALAVDMTNNPGNSTFTIPGLLSGMFDSHFIHFEGIPGIIGVQGTVTFNAPIVGVIFKNTTLDLSDVPCGAFGTVYPTGYPFRGTNTVQPSFFSINANVLTFNLNSLASIAEVAQIRVITQPIPAPGAAAMLGLGGLAMARRRRN